MKIFIATKNEDKKKEFLRILSPYGFTVLTEKDLDRPLPETEETGSTFEENAMLKAQTGLKATGLITVADDSGLCVDALNGEPGVYSARYAGGHGDSAANNAKLLEKLKNVPDEKRTARYKVAIACVFPDGRSFTVSGCCEGKIGTAPQGNGGFGYDPLFISEIGCFGNVAPELKDSVSHRGKAIKAFKNELKKYIDL